MCRNADDYEGCDEQDNPYKVHAGFLACSKAVKSALIDHIYNQICDTNVESGIRSNSKPLLLFTGHSAGGAVAAILYAHFSKCEFSSDDRSKSQILKNG